jgi:hypothetical protein
MERPLWMAWIRLVTGMKGREVERMAAMHRIIDDGIPIVC